MEKIFQKFGLDIKMFEKSLESPEFRKKLSGAEEAIREELTSKGYDFLKSDSRFVGLPLFIIIGRDIESINHKNDFSEAVGRYDLPYLSEETYFQID